MENQSHTATLRQQLSSIVGTVPFGILTVSDDFEVDIINGEAVRLLGFLESRPNDLIDKEYGEVLVNITELLDKFNRLIVNKRCRKFDLNNIKTTNHELNIKCRSMLHGTLIILEDITDEKALLHKVTHDNLTQLVNRQHFEERLATALKKSKENNSDGAIAFLDLDKFKPVNDTAGHAAGDELLKRIATIMQSRIRDTDTVGRIGGDEFAILLEDCPMLIAERIMESIRKDIEAMAFSYNGKSFNMSVSAGLAPVNETYNDITTLLNAADTACQTSKNQGRNQVHVINQKDGEYEAHVKEAAWIDEINKALAQDKFILYAQKIVALNAEVGRSYHEVLLRLKNEDGSITPPNAFIPSAERYEMMPQIDRWVIANAFSLFKTEEHYSINLSGQTLSDVNLASYVLELQEKFKITPSHVTFEITETAAIHNLDRLKAFITELKGKGYKFALDDFGTGLSSFSYLKNMAVDNLKIDGQFVRDIADDEVSFAMVKSINDVGHSMGIYSVAEFVENADILDKLKEIGIDFVQGYHLHKPQPLVEIVNASEVTPLKAVK
jgi:diguanylate cyclase (GGDEF)-like protein